MDFPLFITITSEICQSWDDSVSLLRLAILKGSNLFIFLSIFYCIITLMSIVVSIIECR